MTMRLPAELESLVRESTESCHITGSRRGRFAADLRSHVEDAWLNGEPVASIIREFGDPRFVGALVDRSPPPKPVMHRATLFAAAAVVLLASAYAQSAARLDTFSVRRSAFDATLDSVSAFGAPAMDRSALRAWFMERAASHGGDSLYRALRLAQAMKGIRRPDLGARLAEPVFFLRASSVSDVWHATIEKSPLYTPRWRRASKQ
jgi:hypothetical protein